MIAAKELVVVLSRTELVDFWTFVAESFHFVGMLVQGFQVRPKGGNDVMLSTRRNRCPCGGAAAPCCGSLFSAAPKPDSDDASAKRPSTSATVRTYIVPCLLCLQWLKAKVKAMRERHYHNIFQSLKRPFYGFIPKVSNGVMRSPCE